MHPSPEPDEGLDPEEHRMHLEYSIFDNGIHLLCECGATVALPFCPSPSDVVTAQFHHLLG